MDADSAGMWKEQTQRQGDLFQHMMAVCFWGEAEVNSRGWTSGVQLPDSPGAGRCSANF